MSVCQVEQYYIYLKVSGLDEKREEIESVLDEQQCPVFEFHGDDALTVDDFESECDAMSVESEILSVIEG